MASLILIGEHMLGPLTKYRITLRMLLNLRLVGSRSLGGGGGGTGGLGGDLAQLQAAALLGEAGKAVDGEHKGGVLIRGEGNVVDEAAALALALEQDGGLLDGARAARGTELANVALSGAEDARPRVNALLDAELLLNAKALLSAGAAHEGGEISPDDGVAAATSAKDEHIGGVEVEVSHFIDLDWI